MRFDAYARHLYLEGSANLLKVAIHQASGSLVKVEQAQGNSVSLQGLRPGFYLLEAHTNQGVVRKALNLR